MKCIPISDIRREKQVARRRPSAGRRVGPRHRRVELRHRRVEPRHRRVDVEKYVLNPQATRRDAAKMLVRTLPSSPTTRLTRRAPPAYWLDMTRGYRAANVLAVSKLRLAWCLCTCLSAAFVLGLQLLLRELHAFEDFYTRRIAPFELRPSLLTLAAVLIVASHLAPRFIGERRSVTVTGEATRRVPPPSPAGLANPIQLQEAALERRYVELALSLALAMAVSCFGFLAMDTGYHHYAGPVIWRQNPFDYLLYFGLGFATIVSHFPRRTIIRRSKQRGS